MKKAVYSCLVICLIFTVGCFKEPEKKVEILQGVVTFTCGDVKLNGKDAAVGSRVHDNDILLTGDDSLAVVQLSQTAVITIRPRTELKFSALKIGEDLSQTVSLSQGAGSTFHKVIRKGTSYSVETPLMVAAVRGTSFEVSMTGKKHRVSLLNGSVAVNVPAGEKAPAAPVELTAGQAIDVTTGKAGKPVVMDKKEKEGLGHLDTITAVPDVENAVPERSEVNGGGTAPAPVIEVVPDLVIETILKKISDNPGTQENSFTPSEVSVRKLIKKENRTLDDIKVVFKRIDEIHLFSGRIVKGAIVERGERYSVITTDGVIKVTEKEIQTVRVIR